MLEKHLWIVPSGYTCRLPFDVLAHRKFSQSQYLHFTGASDIILAMLS